MAAREFEVGNRRATAANGGVTAGNPNTVDLDAALDGADSERNVFPGFFALRFQHFRRLYLLALFDLGVFGDAVPVIL